MRLRVRCVLALAVVIVAVCAYAFWKERLARDLYAAVRAGKTEEVRRLLAQGASPECNRGLEPRPLYVAIARRDTEIALMLIEARVAGVPDDYFCHAVASSSPEVIRALIDRGAPLDSPCRDRTTTPLMEAARYRRKDVVRLLLASGASVDYRLQQPSDPILEGETALVRALHTKDVELVKLLLDHGADSNLQFGRNKVSPLMLASMTGEAKVVKLLISRGADTRAKTATGETAVDIAHANLKRVRRPESDAEKRLKAYRPDPRVYEEVLRILKRAEARAKPVRQAR